MELKLFGNKTHHFRSVMYATSLRPLQGGYALSYYLKKQFFNTKLLCSNNFSHNPQRLFQEK